MDAPGGRKFRIVTGAFLDMDSGLLEWSCTRRHTRSRACRAYEVGDLSFSIGELQNARTFRAGAGQPVYTVDSTSLMT